MAFSGRNGAVDGVPCVRSWTINEVASQSTYACSATDGAEGVESGNVDYTGQYSAYGVIPANLPGDTFNFDGNISTAADKGVQLDNAVVLSVTLNWDWESPNPLSHVVTFASTDTALVVGASTAADATIADPTPTVGCQAWWNDPDEETSGSPGAVVTEITGIRTATIILSRPESTFANSEVSGLVGRDVGNLSVEGSLTLHTEDPSDAILRAPNTKNERFRIGTDPTDAADFYEFNRVIIASRGPLNVDIEGGGLVETSIGWRFRPYYNEVDPVPTPTKGNIAWPVSIGGNLWP